MSEPASGAKEKTITTYELLERSAQAALDLQREDGSFPPGRNGVYNEPETPVRTTSHWLTTLSKVYDITGDKVFAEAANDAADYLLSDEARPHGYTFHSRNAEGKDKSDGLVGQMAPIRGLAWGGSVLDRPELLATAAEVVSLHPFNDRLGLWECVEIDGKRFSFDRTLNHQLLFAGAAAHIASEYDTIAQTIRRFVDRLDVNMQLRSDGIIRHYVRPPFSKTVRAVISDPSHWKLLPNNIISRSYTYSSTRKQREIGYHPVNLLGIGYLKHYLRDSSLHGVSDSLIDTITSPSTLSLITDRETYYGSLTPMLDMGVAVHLLRSDQTANIRHWLEIDIQQKYDYDSALLSKATEDPTVQAAVLSKAVNLPNQKLSI